MYVSSHAACVPIAPFAPQGFFALDDVRFINGNQIGTRMLFQVRTHPA